MLKAWDDNDKRMLLCKSFVSLAWLDGSINFVFRFVAKISELLLAIGIVISAADFLTHGRLMQNNIALADAWAWTQAIAIESSGGVVLLYALQAFKDQDKVKGILYGILATMLALVGGVMLLTQIIYSTTGIDMVMQASFWFIVSVGIARTVVSIAYIVMCRIKHVRLSGDEPKASSAIDIKAEIDSAVASALDLAMHQFDIAIQEVKRTVIEEVSQQRLIAIPKDAPSKIASIPPKTIESKLSIDRLARVKDALQVDPKITDPKLAELARCSINTARKYKRLAKEARCL